MRFKLVGLLLLLTGVAMVGYALFLERSVADANKPQVYCLAAIFLIITVRVLQAERHHRASRPRRVAETEMRSFERMTDAHLEEELTR